MPFRLLLLQPLLRNVSAFRGVTLDSVETLPSCLVLARGWTTLGFTDGVVVGQVSRPSRRRNFQRGPFRDRAEESVLPCLQLNRRCANRDPFETKWDLEYYHYRGDGVPSTDGTWRRHRRGGQTPGTKIDVTGRYEGFCNTGPVVLRTRRHRREGAQWWGRTGWEGG